MLAVIHGNRFEALVEALVAALPDPIDPFAGPTVVCASRVVARLVQHEVARARGVWAGGDLPFLERFLATTYLDDAARAAGLRALDRPGLDAALASVLAGLQARAGAGTDGLGELARVAEYLGPAEAADAGLRRVQLAGRLGALYWTYALTRPDWLDAWDAGRTIERAAADAGPELRELRWQGRLWRSTAEHLRRHQAGARHAIVPRLPAARRALGLAAPAPAPGAGPLHVLGFSHLAPTYVDALRDLASAREVRVYALNPCAEFWEDIRRAGNAGGHGRLRRRDEATAPPEQAAWHDGNDPRDPRHQLADASTAAAATDGATDPLLLARWGAPVRDTMALLTAASDGDLEGRFELDEAAPTTALGALLADTLVRAEPGTTAVGPDADGRVEPGLVVRSCPSIRRELEIIGSDILRRLGADPTLRAHHVGVLIAPGVADRYLALAPAVFERLAPGDGRRAGLPFHILDAPITQLGQVGEAALALLELPLGRFTRRELLGVMTHPCVVGRFPHVDPDDWVRWVDRLGIVHGASAADHDATYLAESGQFHWEQGIRRLALGAFMLGDRPGAPAPGVQVGAHALVPEEVSADQAASAATLALLARSLIADARYLAGASLPLARWADVLGALLAAYLHAGDDRARRDLDGVVASAEALRALDLDGRAVPYRELVELMRARVRGLSGDRGEPLCDGVMLAPLAPMRPLPLRVVYVAGLGEGVFPAGDAASPLDQRDPPRRGDVSPRDRDRHAFFEAVLGARDHLALSYVGRHPTSGEALAPSSVVLELAEALAPYLAAPGAAAAQPGAAAVLAALTEVHPLHRWDERYQAGPLLAAASVAPTLAVERAAIAARVALGQHLRRRGLAVPGQADLRRLLDGPAHARTRRALGLDLIAGAAATPPSLEPPRTLSLAVVRKFLESPVQAWAEAVLRLDEAADEEVETRSDEPMVESGLVRAVLLREVVGVLLRAGQAGVAPTAAELHASYEQIRRRHLARGTLPVGVLGQVPAEDDLARLTRWMEHLAPHRGGARRVAFGRARDQADQLEPGIPLELALGPDSTRRATVELVGQTELLAGPGSIVVAAGGKRSSHILRGLLDQLALSAAGLHAGPYTITILSSDDKIQVHQAAAWTQAEARAHLTALVTELVDGRHGYLLPFDAADQALRGKELKLPARSDEYNTRLGYGPVDREVGLDLPADGLTLAQARLGPMLGRVVGYLDKKGGAS